jgi:hypothetical protein
LAIMPHAPPSSRRQVRGSKRPPKALKAKPRRHGQCVGVNPAMTIFSPTFSPLPAGDIPLSKRKRRAEAGR